MYYPQNDCNNENIKNNISFIRFLHAVPNTPPVNVDIYVNNKPVVKNLKYEDFTEYIPTKSGVYSIQVYPSGNRTEQLLDIRITTEPDKIYTLAVIGTVSDIELEVFEDYQIKDENTAFMRFANVSPTNTAFNVSIDDIPVVYDLQYLEVTDYLAVSEGKHTLRISTENGVTVVSHPNMVLKNGNIYTSYIVGLIEEPPEVQVLIPLDGSSYIKTNA